jgi:hypothetical protein
MSDLKERLLEVIGELRISTLPQSCIDFYYELVEAGELAVTLECLCDDLLEFDVSLSVAMGEEIRSLCVMCGVTERYWRRLAPC